MARVKPFPRKRSPPNREKYNEIIRSFSARSVCRCVDRRQPVNHSRCWERRLVTVPGSEWKWSLVYHWAAARIRSREECRVENRSTAGPLVTSLDEGSDIYYGILEG